MAIVHSKSLRKPSGGMRRPHRKKKKYEIGRPYVPAIVGEERRKKIRVRGGNIKIRLTGVKFVNLAKKDGVKKVKVIEVVENPANPFFVRRNIVTKGAIVKTEEGYARITSRPGQHGVANAVLLPNYKPSKKK